MASARRVAVGGSAAERWGEGDVVAGVRLTGRVGRGGSGVVWAGWEAASGERVAVKLLDEPVAAASEGVLLRAASHSHVVRVRRVLHEPPALVLDLAEGGSVASLVRARGVLDPGEVVTVLAPLAGALASLRDSGLCHGDVTAANVLLLGDGRPVLADLGAARLLGVGPLCATSGFAAPEVAAGGTPGPAADVHGLGAVGWLALTGSPPGPPPERVPLPLLSPECPDELAEAVTAAVDPRPAGRPRAEELARLLHAAARPRPVRLVPGAMPALRPDEAVTRDAGGCRQAPVAGDTPEPGRASRVGDRQRRVRARPPGPRAAAATAALLTVAGVLAGVVAATTLAPAGGEHAVLEPARGGGSPVTARPSGTAGFPSTAGFPGTGSAQEVETAVRGLVAARGEALRLADPDLLAQVYAPGSEALAADQAVVARGPLAVTYEVLAVELADPGPGEETAASSPAASAGGRAAQADHAHTVDVVLRTQRRDEPALTERVRLRLAGSAEGWSILAVVEPT